MPPPSSIKSAKSIKSEKKIEEGKEKKDQEKDERGERMEKWTQGEEKIVGEQRGEERDESKSVSFLKLVCNNLQSFDNSQLQLVA